MSKPKPAYTRGIYSLEKRPDRTNYDIVWYDRAARRQRGTSARTCDLAEAIKALDRKYLGQEACPTCGRAYERQGSLVVTAIADYLTMKEGSHAYHSASVRLRHCLGFVVEKNPAMLCANVTERTIEQFRTYMAAKTYRTPAGRVKPLSLSTTEGCVLALAAAINATGEKAQFKAMNLRSVSNTPQHRSSIAELAAMFQYALDRPRGKNLLRYLRAAVATMARPDAVMDIHNGRRQWVSAARVLNLNPEGRRQTKKHRPIIPIAKQFAPHLDAITGPYIPVASIRSEWQRMARELGLPGEGEAGWKLIRRSMATLLRNRLGEQYMPQIERFLGHRQESMSDIYALASPAQLGRALREIEKIIAEIERLAPGAFSA